MTVNEQQIAEKIKALLVENLGIDPEILTDDIPLFGDEIGLDSIDSMEIIACIDDAFGVSMTGTGRENFRDVASLAAYVAAHQE